MAQRIRLRMSTPREVRKALVKISNMLINDELDPKVANALIMACNVTLSSIRTDEQQRKIDELERLMMGRDE